MGAASRRTGGRWIANEDDLRTLLGPDALFVAYPRLDDTESAVAYIDVCGGVVVTLPCTAGCVWKTIAQAALRGWIHKAGIAP